MKTRFWLIAFTGLWLSTPALSDVLSMPEPAEIPESEPSEMPIDVPAQTLSFTLPGRGMTKDTVEERFGTPSERIHAIGEPPISRWVYGNFTVYFEYDHVVHAVLHKR